jgi:hypothetical protein
MAGLRSWLVPSGRWLLVWAGLCLLTEVGFRAAGLTAGLGGGTLAEVAIWGIVVRVIQGVVSRVKERKGKPSAPSSQVSGH